MCHTKACVIFSKLQVEESSDDTFEHILSAKDLSFKQERKFQIGHGSFGAVYKGKLKGKPCAVKVFYKQFTDKTSKYEHEAMISALSHPHIVKVHGLCCISDRDSNKPQVALVMDLCDGNLASYLAVKVKGSYSLAHKLVILQQVTEAIIYLHGKRIVHGDLSAPNILMVNSPKQPPNVKIADFGQARVLNPDTLKHQTNTRGRDDIMPPEILHSSTDVVELTHSVDLFSFGCLAPYVATGKYPTPADVGNAFEKRVHHLNVMSEVSRRIFEDIMKKCLDERPHWRGTFEAVHERLAPEINKYVTGKYPISMEEKTAKIERLEGELRRQQQQVDELKERLSCSEVKCTELQMDLSAAQHTSSEYEKELTDQNRANIWSKTRINEMEVIWKSDEHLSQLNVEVLEDSLAKRDLKLMALEEDLKLKEVIWKSDEHLSQLNVEVLEGSLAERDLKLKALEEDLKLKEGHIKQLEAAVVSGNTERTQLAAVQVTELEKLKKEKTEGQLIWDEKSHALQREIGALKTDLMAYQDVEQKLKEEKEQLEIEKKQLIEQVKEKEGKLAKYEEIETQLKRDHAQVENERNQTQSELQQQKNDWESLEKDYAKQIMSLDKLTKEHDKLKGEAKSLKQRLQKKVLEIDSLKQKCEDTETQLTLKLGTAERERDQAQLERELHKQEQKKLFEDYTEKLKKLDNVTKECQKLTLDHQRMQKEHAEEKISVEQSNLQCTELKKENDDLQSSLSNERATVQSSRTERDTLQSNVRGLKTEIENLRSAKKTLESKLAESQESEKKLKKAFKETRKEVLKWQSTADAREVRIQDAKEELRDLEKYRKRVQDLRNLLREANTKASEDKTTISELETKRNSQTTEESQQRQDIEGPLLVEINTLKERLSQRETDLQSFNGRISELERDIDASKAHSAELQSELNHTGTGLTSTLAELNNTQDGLEKAQEQNEASSSRCQELEQQCQELRQHIAELESVQDRLQKREEDLNQQVEILKSEQDTAQRQAQDFDRDGRDLKREVQALKEKGRHRREVMQQVVKLLQTQVAAVRSDLDQERSRQRDLKDSVEQLLTRSYIVRSLKTELVSRAAELHKCRDKLQKCRDELKTTTAERDKLNQSETSAASQVSMQQQLHQFQEHVTQSLGQVHDRVAKVAADVSAVPELNRGVQQLHRQMSSSSSLDQSSMSGQQLTSRSQKLESAIDSEEHLDPDLMTSDASSDVPITGQQRTLSSARLQPTPEEDPGLETVTSIALDLPDNGNGHHQLSPDSSPSSVDPHTTEVTTSPTEERDLVADLSRPTGPEHEMRTNSPDISRMDRQPAISHYRQPSASDCHQPSASDHQQPSASDRHQPSVNDRDPQSFRDHPPRPWSEDNMDPLLINAPNPSLLTRIAGQRTHFSNVASYSACPFQSNLMSFGGFLVPVPMSFPTTSVMPIHDNPSPISLPSSSGSSFPMHGGRDSSLSATVATSLQDSVDPALLKKRITKLSELMPYVPDLAHKVPQIAGYLDMYTKLQALKQTCSDPEIHLQELLSQWLEGQEDEERPHYWEYFITLVKAVDQYPVVRRIYIDLAAGQTKS